MAEAAINPIYVYESCGAAPEAQEWDLVQVKCGECGHEYTAVIHGPTYQEQGRLRCVCCLRYRAYLKTDAYGGRPH